ncbi:MAG: arginine--tRNA ligase [Actinomycetota bacterium]|nr:arginine--tRNA ligase [Actinomycetota bacterium]
MITETITSSLKKALEDLEVSDLPSEINLEQPANKDHGDWSSNIALATAKNAGWSPRDLASEIAELINSDLPNGVENVTIAGPGFINFALSPQWLHDVLQTVLDQGTEEFGKVDVGQGRKVNVEFVSANPTGPLHAGHARGACYGDSIASILDAVGYEVEREFYVNDRGLQMGLFAESLLAFKSGKDVPEGGYGGAYVEAWSHEMPNNLSVHEALDWGCQYAMEDQRSTLEMIGIVFDTWFSERSMVESGAIEQTMKDLGEKEASYSQDGATWLRSTDYGDDKDRVLVKSDGEFTYLTPDVTYHREKFSRADWLINVWGADHHGYIARMKAAMEALGHDPEQLTVAITQLVKLVRSGEEVRLSKRQGDIIELREIVEEIGPDATRFMYLLQSVDTKQTFDLDLAASKVMDNPVFYVQMAHARIRSIQSKAEAMSMWPVEGLDIDLSLLEHERELEVLKNLFNFPDVVQLSARELAPHKIAVWLRELATSVHGFYHDCYVVGDTVPPELSAARLQLVEAARIGLVSGLDLLGVSAPDSM